MRNLTTLFGLGISLLTFFGCGETETSVWRLPPDHPRRVQAEEDQRRRHAEELESRIVMYNQAVQEQANLGWITGTVIEEVLEGDYFDLQGFLHGNGYGNYFFGSSQGQIDGQLFGTGQSVYSLGILTDNRRRIGLSIIDSVDENGQVVTKEMLDAVIQPGTRIAFPVGVGIYDVHDGFWPLRYDSEETIFSENTRFGTRRVSNIYVLE